MRAPFRRGYTIQELLVALAMFTSLIVVVYGTTATLARHQSELIGYVGDLDHTVSVVDRVARTVREARAVVSGTPDRRVRTGAGALVLQRPEGGLHAFVLNVTRTGSRLQLLDYDARGRLRAEFDLGPVGGVRFRFNARQPSEVTLVTLEVLLPRRSEDAPPAPLSTRARVGREAHP